MRLIAGLTATALLGIAAAASQQQSADVYLFPSSSSSQSTSDTPSIPKEVARHILLQRLSTQRYGSDLRDIPSSVDAATAVAHIARFGKSPAPLFAQSTKPDASQLVIIVEGASAEDSSRAKEKLAQHAAFRVSDPPSAAANKNLVALFRNMGAAPAKDCAMEASINPFETDCWAGSTSVMKYDLRQAPTTLDVLYDNLSRLNKFANDGDLEVLLLVLPESSRSSKLSHWSVAAAGASDLHRRRDAETVISDQDTASSNANPPAAKPAAASAPAARRTKAIPQCFASASSCMTQTDSCSGHGECVNKYGSGSGGNSSTSAASCFVCVCKASAVDHGDGAHPKGRKTIQWGGNKCQKRDLSVPFWLITGFTVAIVGAVTFAIGMLFSVGQEPLPGVIGAGVSRSK
ncbi:hypothetical protein C8A05DRAFT_31964 [Staphylotrichum tortipilum]|uniref:Vacuolar sorting protein Vps3844 C-terminal domain-containing protein n=1 Tax=Staphylotrichum tortipilum TaxID=2831512 RepID=A0AAN6MQT6_9PEZI|nr:hypothetical protein C8A05DRAFT_31964 [Staphylotrichum longicolle]